MANVKSSHAGVFLCRLYFDLGKHLVDISTRMCSLYSQSAFMVNAAIAHSWALPKYHALFLPWNMSMRARLIGLVLVYLVFMIFSAAYPTTTLRSHILNEKRGRYGSFGLTRSGIELQWQRTLHALDPRVGVSKLGMSRYPWSKAWWRFHKCMQE